MTGIDFLLKALELKDETRTGWDLRGVENPESVADHSWGTAFLTFLFSEEAGVDRERAVLQAVIHDLAEVETGDLPFRDEVEKDKQEWTEDEKREAEKEIMERLSDNLDSSEILELWKEYEDRDTRESRFVKDMDLIDMCLQALFYEKRERYDPEEKNDEFEEYENMDEFFATTEPRISTDTGRELFETVKERYERAKR